MSIGAGLRLKDLKRCQGIRIHKPGGFLVFGKFTRRTANLAYIMALRLNISIVEIRNAVLISSPPGKYSTAFLLPMYVSNAPAHPTLRRLSMSIHVDSLNSLP